MPRGSAAPEVHLYTQLVDMHPLPATFLRLRDKRAINPISKTNWEGTGVEPDVKVPAVEALEVAKKLAAKK